MSEQSVDSVDRRSPTPDMELCELSSWYEILQDDEDNILNWFTPVTARDVCQEVLAFAQERSMPVEKIVKWKQILDKICAQIAQKK